MSNTENTVKRFCIILATRNGRTWYHSTNAGTMTCKMASLWTTADRDEAIALAGPMGGTVVPAGW